MPAIAIGKGKGKSADTVWCPLEGPFGPIWVKDGWVHGYKVFIGDLPTNFSKPTLYQACGHCLDHCRDVNVAKNKAMSGMAYAICTFDSIDEGAKLFRYASMLQFDGHWTSVKWFRGKPY